jgi:molybdopterin synthase catalytic subunit
MEEGESSTYRGPWELADPNFNVHVSVTYHPLDLNTTINRVRRPEAGAIVFFMGTTRVTTDDKGVANLSYTSYIPLALYNLSNIAHELSKTYKLCGIAIIHRLGEVAVGEESIHVAVSAPHRKEAWTAGQLALEECKNRVEVWKKEVFAGNGESVWRANNEACN